MSFSIHEKNGMLARAILVGVFVALLIGGTAFAVTEGGGGHDAEAKGWLPTDTYRVINFAILAIGLFLLLRKPAAQALNGRIKGIKDQLEDLESRKKAAEKELAEYNEKIARLDKEAERIIAEYVRQGNDAKDRILKEAEATAEKLEEQARRNIESEFAKAKMKLQTEVVENALKKAEGMIRESITGDDQNRLVDEYLEKVVA